MSATNPRGEFRSVYVVLLDTEEYQQLSIAGKLVLLTLKFMLPWSGIAVVSPHTIREKVGLAVRQDVVNRALGELEQGGWIQREKNVVWLVNGLKYEPHLSAKQDLHREGVQRRVASLPRLTIVDRFREYYPEWFAPVEPRTRKAKEPVRGSGSTNGADNPSESHAASHTKGMPKPSESPADATAKGRLTSTTSLSQNNRTTPTLTKGDREGLSTVSPRAEFFDAALVQAFFAAHPDDLAAIERSIAATFPETLKGAWVEPARAAALEHAMQLRYRQHVVGTQGGLT